MARRDPRALRDDAARAAAEGKHRRAVECYLELEQLEPSEPSWSKRAAEMYRRLDRPREAIAAYERAVDRYAQGGFMVQAIAVCKVILQLDPASDHAKRKLAAISEQQDAGRSQASVLSDRHRSLHSLPVVELLRSGGAPTRKPTPPTSSVVFARPGLDRPGVDDGATADEGDGQGAGDGAADDPPAIELYAADELSLDAPIGPPTIDELLATVDGAEVDADELIEEITPVHRPRLDDRPGTGRDDRPGPRVDDRPGTGRGSRLARAAIERARAEGRPAAGGISTAAPDDTDDTDGVPRDDDRERSQGSITIDRGAPLDSVALADVVRGAHPTYNDRGDSSGIIIIPIDDEPSSPVEGLEIHAFSVGPSDDDDAAIEIEPDDEPEDLSIDDLEEVPLLAEPKAYSASARRALGATPLFASLSSAALESLIDHLSLVDLVAGDRLFREGDPGTTLYVVVEGEVAVISEGNPRIEVSRLGPGAFFGEVALVTEQPRSATIEATALTQLLAIDRDVISTLVAEHADVLPVILRFLRERLVDRLVQTHPLFTPFADADRRQLVSRFKFLEIEPGTTIIQQGVHALGLYALLAGRVEVSIDGKPVGTLGSGELFGMTSLLTGKVSTKTVRSLPKCLALCLPASDFREVIMTHPQVLSYIGDLADERERALAAARLDPRRKMTP